MLSPMVSVIVPVYNTEQYIDECISSILEQTYCNYEIIIVNDGSTDDSLKKCMDYENKYNNIKLISIVNSGPSKARNVAMKVAKGDLYYFIDSDDKIATDLLEIMVNRLLNDNSDIVICDYYKWNASLESVNYNIKYLNNNEEGITLLSKRIIDDFLWNKIFRKKIFDGICFDEKLYVYEDMDVMHLLFERASKISYINKNLYYYRQRKDSSVNNLDFNKKMNFFLVQEKRYSYLSSKYERIEKFLFHSLVVALMSVYKYAIQNNELEDVRSQLMEQYKKLNGRIDCSSIITIIFTISESLFIAYGNRRWKHGN